MASTPIWKIRSGQFAGWHTTDALFNAEGRHVGYLAGHVAYGLDGRFLGEIYQGEWIGRHNAAKHSPGEPHEQADSVAHARLADRAGLALADWSDPALD